MRYMIKIMLLTLLVANPPMARPDTLHPDLLVVRISLDQATRQIIGKGRNRVLGAQTVIIDGREVHVIKVLTPDGRIQYFKIDAETGAVIG